MVTENAIDLPAAGPPALVKVIMMKAIRWLVVATTALSAGSAMATSPQFHAAAPASGRIDAGAGTTEFNCGTYYFRAASQCGNFAVIASGTLARFGGTDAFNGFITLSAGAGLSEGDNGGGTGGITPGPSHSPVADDSFSAYVDPVISLLGGFDPRDFILSLCAGVVNGSGGSNPFGGGGGILPPPPGGVLKPASWALMLCGFGLTGARHRRRAPLAST